MLEQLYRLTPLEDGFSINNVALVDGGPRTLGLKELLQVYVDHRLSVVTRRSRYRLERRRERLHLVEGLLIAILDIDEVIQVIRTSDDSDAARTRLMEVFDLSQVQAEYILELRLRRLTRFSRIELETERDQLHREIEELEAILADPARTRGCSSPTSSKPPPSVSAPRAARCSPRLDPPSRPTRARLAAAAPDLEIADAPCRIFLSTTGRIIRVDLPEDGSELPAAKRRSKHDAIRSTLDATIARRNRRRHIARPPASIHRGRPALRAGELDPARRRCPDRRLPRARQQEGTRARPRLARLRRPDRARNRPGRRQARRSRIPRQARARDHRAQTRR